MICWVPWRRHDAGDVKSLKRHFDVDGGGSIDAPVLQMKSP